MISFNSEISVLAPRSLFLSELHCYGVKRFLQTKVLSATAQADAGMRFGRGVFEEDVQSPSVPFLASST